MFKSVLIWKVWSETWEVSRKFISFISGKYVHMWDCNYLMSGAGPLKLAEKYWGGCKAMPRGRAVFRKDGRKCAFSKSAFTLLSPNPLSITAPCNISTAVAARMPHLSSMCWTAKQFCLKIDASPKNRSRQQPHLWPERHSEVNENPVCPRRLLHL